jgi:hypothetical protein
VNNKLLLDGDTYSNLEKILPSSNYQHLYITSDEEIEDCWVLNTHTNEVYFLKGYYGIQPITKKIILTTDQSLKGVQAIDDEFLEWFVKNPSCEEVEVDENWNYPLDKKWQYNIIIPKEEPKDVVLGYKTSLEAQMLNSKHTQQVKDINYWKNNCEEDYITTPISVLRYISELEKLVESSQTETEINEDTSDGYHTFKELYEFRKAYNVALFNQWSSILVDFTLKYDVHKSWKHHDGELCFGGGWFIVVAVLPTGQISNHYPASDWDFFKIPEVEKAKYEFDGHTGQDVIDRLLNI